MTPEEYRAALTRMIATIPPNSDYAHLSALCYDRNPKPQSLGRMIDTITFHPIYEEVMEPFRRDRHYVSAPRLVLRKYGVEEVSSWHIDLLCDWCRHARRVGCIACSPLSDILRTVEYTFEWEGWCESFGHSTDCAPMFADWLEEQDEAFADIAKTLRDLAQGIMPPAPEKIADMLES
jgi:hypothetical protein